SDERRVSPSPQPSPPGEGEPNRKLQPGNGAEGNGASDSLFVSAGMVPPLPDPLLQRRGGEDAGNGGRVKFHSPSSVELPVVEPWPEPVDGKELLDAIMSELQRVVVFPIWAAETFALW